jgi:hypothetical protein
MGVWGCPLDQLEFRDLRFLRQALGDHHAVSDPHDLEQLREEVTRLSAENAHLRAQLRVPTPGAIEPADKASKPHAVCVLLMPDPAMQRVGQGPPVLDLARSLVGILSQRQPNVAWRAEHDLDQVPARASCYDLGEAAQRLFDSSQPLPKTYEIIAGEDGRRVLRRRVVPREPESDRYLTGYERQLQIVNDLLAEGEAAYDARAAQHAGWAMRAVDVVLARIKLAQAYFEAGRDGWKDELSTPRPEFDPRYRIDAEHPAGL